MGEENSFVFKVYVKDQRRIEQVQEMMDSMEIGNLEWDGFEVKRDRAGNYIEATATVSPKFVKKVEARVAKIGFVDRVKVASEGSGGSAKNTSNDKCTSNRLLNESSVATLDYAVDYAIGQLRLMRGHLATATDGNIRGRLVVNFEGDMAVGSSISVLGKMRYHETNYRLTDATTISWYASRSNSEWTLVATGPTYTPIAEDAGKKVSVAIHNKGVVNEWEVGAVHVNQDLENEIQELLKKKRAMTMSVQVMTELTAEESSKAGRHGEDSITINKKGVQLVKGGRVIYKKEHGSEAVLFTVRTEPAHAILRLGEREIELAFASAAECAKLVLAARAYGAWDTLCMICSLPPVDKQITPDVSIVNALIQAGSAVQPFTWNVAPDLQPPMPEVDDQDLDTLTQAVQKLVSSRRIKASTQAILVGMLSAISQGSSTVTLPRPQAWVEPESEEEPEEEEEEEMPPEESSGMGAEVAPGGVISETECEKRIKEAPEGPWSISPEVYQKFKKFFLMGTENDLYDVAKGIELFAKSGQKEKLINEVVTLICEKRDKMNLMEFVVIMHILKKIKDGNNMFKSIPEELDYVLKGPSSKPNVSTAVSTKPAKTPVKPAKKPAKESKEPEMKEKGEDEWSVNEGMVKKLRNSFMKLSEGNEEVSIGKAMKTFVKSEVKPRDVGNVVKMVCNGQPKTIQSGEFVVIMVILQQIRKGSDVPSSVPEPLESLLGGKKKAGKAGKPGKAPARRDEEEEEEGSEWNIDKNTYGKLKKMFDQQTDGEETMAPALAIKCFKKSGVEEDTVKSVTKMVLKGHKGPVELGQFVVIMYVLKMIREGASAPTTLPASLKKFL
ncbi:hypothetical protein WA171_001712 [Blastocystis sp. BT1]